MLDYPSLLYGPTYILHGTDAVLRVGGTEYNLRVLDDSAGVALGTGMTIETILPAARCLVKDLTALGLSRSVLDGAGLTMNGTDWVISSTQPKPSPGGEQAGELYMILEGNE